MVILSVFFWTHRFIGPGRVSNGPHHDNVVDVDILGKHIPMYPSTDVLVIKRNMQNFVFLTKNKPTLIWSWSEKATRMVQESTI
jgi:hypothetical protein